MGVINLVIAKPIFRFELIFTYRKGLLKVNSERELLHKRLYKGMNGQNDQILFDGFVIPFTNFAQLV